MGERVVDVVVLAVGALAVLVAVVLFSVLPESTQPSRQFVVTFVDDVVEQGPQEASLTEGQQALVSFEVARGNLSTLEVTLAFSDDVAASDPDQLSLEVVGPDGTVRPPTVTTANLLPQLRTGSAPPAYDAVQRTLTVVVNVNDRPGTQAVAAADQRETAEEAAIRVAPIFSADGSGTWTLRLSLTAGDCPDPSLDPQRAAACQGAAPGGADTTNAVQVVRFRSSHWSAGLVPV